MALIKKDKSQAKAEKEKIKRSLAFKIKTMLVVNIILFAAFAIYSYRNYSNYSALKGIASHSEETIQTLKASLSNVHKTYQDKKESFQTQKAEVEKDIEVIFPEESAYTELTRQLDKFFFELNSINPPIIHNNLNFDDPQPSEDNEYIILPFSMSIQSSKDNFERFLDYVDNSGAIDSQIRLMSIQSIQINFIQPSEDNINEFDINFTVNMHAYFQNNKIVQ